MLIVTAAAIFDEDSRVLISQRPKGKAMEGLWEFPGGKVESDETPEESLVRELKEELDITSSPCCLSPISFVTYPKDIDKSADYIKSLNVPCDPSMRPADIDPDDLMLLMLYRLSRWSGNINPQENQQTKWIELNEFRNYQMPPADKPLVRMLQDLYLRSNQRILEPTSESF